MVYFREITEHYRIEKTLRSRQEGGVFRATDPVTGTPVALKLIPLAGAPPESAQAFVRGMGTFQSLRHPSLPALYDFGFTPDGYAFLVLEHVDGRGAEALQGGEPAQILPLLAEVLDGLERMAKEGLAHHNLCPENLLVVPGPAPGRIKMVGLGSALLRLPGARPEGEAAGFAAPELGRLSGTGAEDGAAPWPSDLFSLALIACRLLEARLDTDGDDPRSPRVSLPLAVSFELEDDQTLQEVLSRCLRFRPAERSGFAEVRRALERALSGNTGGGGPRPLPQSRLFVSAEPESAPWLPPVAPPPPPHDPGDDTNPVFRPEPVPTPAAPPLSLAPVPPLAAVPALRPSRRPGRLVWAGVAAAVLLLGVPALLWLSHRSTAPAAVPAPRPAARVAAPLPAVPAIPATTAATVAIAAPAPPPLPDKLAAARTRLATDFRAALKAGDLRQIAATLRASTAAERTALQAEPGLRRDLAAARRAADLYQRYDRAAKGSDPAELLRTAGAVAAAFPRFLEAVDRREKTAGTLEAEAETLSQTGALEAAQERLETLRRGWPERRGLSERMARLAAEQRADQGIAAVLVAATAAETRKRPDEGLALLAAAKPTPRYEARLRETRQRLEAQLAQLDRNPPVVQLGGAKPAALEFDKGATVRIPLRITDDFQVKAVVIHVRPEGGAWTELPCPRSGADCTVEVPPSLHQNRTIELYAVATDLSGHQGQLGSAEQPQTIRRKHWYDLLRGKSQ